MFVFCISPFVVPFNIMPDEKLKMLQLLIIELKTVDFTPAVFVTLFPEILYP